MAKKKAAKKSIKTKVKAAVKRTTKQTKQASKPRSVSKQVAPPADDAVAIGRVLVSQEEKLYLLFKEDYHARQIFEFLRVETVKDLEQFSPHLIVKLLSQPIQATVLRIRRKLAEKNRHLAEDEAFVVEFKKNALSK
ncbi:MAG TPA: hypothetical protein VGQ93_14630 [Lysobacter sp.]|nr:hypothetical protein [Lysobacter sp.]